MTFPDPFMTKADIAELLRCCERTVERQVKLGAFPPPQRFGKESLWFQSVVHGWLSKRREEQLRWAQVTPAAPGASAQDASAPTPAPPAEPGSPAGPDKPHKKSRVAPRAAATRPQSVFSSEDLARANGGGWGA